MPEIYVMLADHEGLRAAVVGLVRRDGPQSLSDLAAWLGTTVDRIRAATGAPPGDRDGIVVLR